MFYFQVELEQTLQESQYKQQQLELINSRLQRNLKHTTEEKEEREAEAVSLFNALEVNWVSGCQVNYYYYHDSSLMKVSDYVKFLLFHCETK